VRKASPPSDSDQDGWITVKPSRSASSHAVTADDLDEAPYEMIGSAPDDGADEGELGARSSDRAAAEPSDPDLASVPSVSLPDSEQADPVKFEWEPAASFRTRFWCYVVYSAGLLGFGLVLYFERASSLVEMIIVGLFASALAAFVLGTYDRVNLSRDYRGRVVLSKTWRCCFISLGTKPIALRGFHAIATTANAERDVLDWVMLAWLLSLGCMPGVVWWIMVFRKPINQVALTREHGLPAVILYQGVDESHANEMAKAISKVCRYRWRRA
jgi:hypothetical protein